MHLILPELLRVANANARAMVCTTAFYELKDRLLRAFGAPDGVDVQKITRECWTCYGRGKIPPQLVGAYPEPCYHCHGSGVYRRDYILLERWRLGSYVFHRPAGMVTEREPTIIGLIEHAGVTFGDSMRALVALTVLYDPPLFAKLDHIYRGHYAADWWPERVAAREVA